MKKTVLTISLFILFVAVESRLLAGQVVPSTNKLIVPFKMSSTGHQVVTFIYDGKPMRMQLDTGAGGNVVSKKAVKRLKLNETAQKGKGAGLGTMSAAMTEVTPIVVVSGKTKLFLRDLASMDLSYTEIVGGKNGVDGLLGTTFFDAYGAKIDFASMTMTLTLNNDKTNIKAQPTAAPVAKPTNNEKTNPESGK